MTEDELIGLLAAADRVEASACYLKHAVTAELIRRRPAAECEPKGPARMPEAWDEFTADELRWPLAETRPAADVMLGLAHTLEVKLPGTREAFRSGNLRGSKAEIIARATAVLDPGEARAAENLVLGRAGTLSPGGLRAAIARAVLEVAPDKARQRREQAARDARVERWPEDSGNAALAGRELPPARVLAADQRITWWARQLKHAGLEGSLDELRARAFLDLLLDIDSRPGGPGAGAADGSRGTDAANGGRVTGAAGGGTAGATNRGPGTSGPGDDRVDEPGPPHPAGPHSPPGSGTHPAGRASRNPGSTGPAPGSTSPGPGFTGRTHLTVPLATLLGLAERPGELPGLGSVDPALARDLARASAASPQTTWCVTVTDEHGHAIGHGCARPEPANHDRHRGKRQPRPRDGPGSTFTTSGQPGPPGFAFTATDQPGPPGGYGTWRLTTGIPGQRAWLVAVDPIPVGTCDHRFQASGHDPGVKLRHLAQIRHAMCTGPMCRRPSARADFEHNTPYEQGGRSCLCNAGPKCRHEHRLKQDRRFTVEQLPGGTFRWTAPSGRTYTTEPTRYPI